MRLTLAALLTVVGIHTGLADTVFIVNPSANVTSLSKQDMENVLVGKKVKWDSGGAIKLALLESEGADFIKKVTAKSPDQVINSWKKLVFTGQGTMPKLFKSEDELIGYVASTPGACGYASAGKGGGKVKEIAAP